MARTLTRDPLLRRHSYPTLQAMMASNPQPDYDISPGYKPFELQTITEADRESYHGLRRGSCDVSLISRSSSNRRNPAVASRRNGLYLPENPVTASSSPRSSRAPSRAASRAPSPIPTPAGSLRHEPKSSRTEDSNSTNQEEPSPTETKEAGQPFWDIFKTTPKEKVTCNTEGFFLTLLKSSKLLAYIFMFIGTLSTAMLSKGSLLVLTGQLGGMSTFQQTEMDGLVYLLLLILCIPHGFSFLISCASGWFGNDPGPTKQMRFLVLLLETFHSAGQTFFVMYVMPRLPPMTILALLLAVGQIPALVKAFCFQQNGIGQHSPKFRAILRLFDILALLMQLFVVACIFSEDIFDLNVGRTVANDVVDEIRNQTGFKTINASNSIIPVWAVKILTELSLVALTIRWWEAYACTDISFRSHKLPLKRLVVKLHRARAKTHIIVSLWKIIITVLVTYLIFGGLGDMGKVFREWYSKIKHHADPISNISLLNSSSEQNNSSLVEVVINLPNAASTGAVIFSDWVLIVPFLVHVFTSWVLYHLATVACRLHMQRVCFAIPLLLVTPLLMGVLSTVCSEFFPVKTALDNFLSWECLQERGESTLKTLLFALLWWVSSIWITAHIWTPDNERLAFVNRLFVIPVFDPVLSEQSFLYARRKDDHFDRKDVTKGDNISNDSAFVDSSQSTENDPNTTIFICATMWHENVNEMVQMLKSVFRMDRDQSARRHFRDMVTDFKDTDYYEFEAHIFFDDSMDMTEDGFSKPNGFVEQLVTVIHKAASEIHQRATILDPPSKMVTPYGGRLEWTLLGGNKLVAHLKDKNKIRHRKRWSQVMYMYYFLGYRMFLDTDATITGPRDSYDSVIDQLPPEIKLKAENTYLLALDGDVDFRPEAVLLLVDMMKKNKQVGAACGRIKPIGSGPVMWYQRFEYAIGHWLQKAAEHMYGCVLCSPGCFSLFRGLALMDNNVMRTYATKPTQARHYLQYDQGEDRWLCTLLLQRGYKIEYCAAADALTYVPETFKEFFNQRRRWGPSTTANIMDLLGSFRETVRVNPNISYLYMLYQFVLLASSLLGPATVMLMVQTSLQSVFYGVPGWLTYCMTFLPTVIFVILCFKCKSDTQLVVAAVFSSFYALVMMAVIAGTIVNIIQDGWYSPNAIFMYIVIGVFVVAGFMHPKEMFDLPWGVLYFLCVPSTFIYLMIYSICNLNIVSWGTREVKKPVVIDDVGKSQGRGPGGGEPEDPITLAIEEIRGQQQQQQNQPAGFMRRFNIFNRNSRANNMVMLAFLQALREMRSGGAPNAQAARPRQRKISSVSVAHRPQPLPPDEQDDTGIDDCESETEINPDEWLQDPKLGDGKQDQLEEKEKQFFDGLIEKYLHPLSSNKEEEAKISADLIELRNNVSFAFFMLNGLWLVIMIALQEVKSFVNITIVIDKNEVLRMEPLGLLFLVIFAIILILQFGAMLMHRYDTFTHILSTTSICQCHKQDTKQEMGKKALVKLGGIDNFTAAGFANVDVAHGSAVTVNINPPSELSPDYPDEDFNTNQQQPSLGRDYDKESAYSPGYHNSNGTPGWNSSASFMPFANVGYPSKTSVENLLRRLERYKPEYGIQQTISRMSRYRR
ncbi:chitin synthase chs-2-like isoform X2 [Liolophura sinensis]|uniref:chitin synthase chs-2-like isoform X2 n=1 Tax=Liolophura sinensis TaxID=3198878 RepID=UPI0031586110